MSDIGAGELARAGIAIGLVALAAIGAMIQGRSRGEPEASVRAPKFTTVTTVRREPASPAIRLDASAETDPFFSPMPALPIGQTFLPRVLYGAEHFCQGLAALGFPDAKWAASQVFSGEWECASPLRADGVGEGTAFLVARGRRTDAVGSLMLRMNPATPADRPPLVALAERVGDAFAAETGLILPDERSTLLRDWASGETAGIGGRMRLVVDRSKPDSRILNLSVEPRFAALPGYPCRAECFAEMRALAKVADTREVKAAEL